MELVTALAVGVFIAHATGYTTYVRGICRGEIKPDVTSWSTWVVGNVANALTYWVGTEGDVFKNILPVTCLVGSVIVWGIAFTRDTFDRLTKWGWAVIITEVIAILVWWMFQEALWANLFVQISTIISFIPIMLGAWARSEVERPLPWMFWTIAYALQLPLVILDWVTWEELAYPVVCVIFHFAVGMFALRHHFMNRKR